LGRWRHGFFPQPAPQHDGELRARRLRALGAAGHAIDVNPVENPYVTADGYVSPPAGAPYKDRSQRAKGLIHRNGPAVAAFTENGWEWLGRSWPKDYQHFSLSGH
jgi:hypothetical protein